MKRRLSYLLVILVIISLIFSGCKVKVHDRRTMSESSNGTVFMWEVRPKEGDGRLYLLGSIHVGNDGMYPLNPVIIKAFETSDVLAIECDPISALQRPDYLKLVEKLIYTDGTTIKDHIPGDLYDRTEAYLNEKGLSIRFFSIYKPIVLAQNITNLMLDEWGYSSDNGIDFYFIELARERDMEIVEIESVDFQYELLGGFPDEIQAMELKSTLDYIDEYKDILDEMIAYWSSGDVENFERLLFQEDDSLNPEEKELYREYEKQMYDDRNINMADKAEEYLKSGKTTFFVVGAAHMVGENGILNLLRDRGYTVVQK